MNIDNHKIRDITGNNNYIINGDGTINVINSIPEPNENIMFSLLTNIAKMIANTNVRPELPDNLPYDVTDKIKFNDIQTYLEYQEIYDDGICIIEQRLRSIEENATGSIKPQIFRYVNGVFRRVKRSKQDLTADQIVHEVENIITFELRDYYKHTLSPEDLSHIEFVVYYVFASCKIFDKPTHQFLAQKNVNP
ncbi:hypothetical protein OHW83_10545 [Acinetobacter baumannii]|uniref:hypothetical protein n=1 Tax=Acinetobacter baumannii TaxID=470 RepID=UPI001868B56A|nr:hypothetical protein [Acinetobacter baumannii]MCY2773809.1 hypothetical protein [Acinetobacter baumannii]MCY2775226.1 hypothetical protein [Acinetobacter baumannii]MCY2798163.1 hypothetical protein [Acinetobacter baumannii]MCY2805620.1 hypothetical protein [Acinetobacter baumannii]MCY2885483.1 hypothetical protein [Acinetobacter baumannii]